MNVKKKARRVMSGLLTAVTVLSTVLSPAVAYASDDAGSVKKIPYYEEIKDQLDEDEVVTAKDYEIKVGDNFDVKSDYTGLTIQDDSKVKVTFQEAKDTDGNDFSTDYANSYKAVYYVEPQTTDHPTYQINRKIVVKEADQQKDSQSESSSDQDAGSSDKTETEDSEADSSTEETDAADTESKTELTEKEFDAEIEATEDQETVDPETGITLSEVMQEAVDQEVALADLEAGESITFDMPMMLVSGETGTKSVTVTAGSWYYYADYGLGSYLTCPYYVKWGSINATAYCVEPSKKGPGNGTYTIQKLADGKTLAKVCYYGTKASDETGFFDEKHPDFPAGKRFIITHLAAAYANGSSDWASGTNATGKNLAMELYNYCVNMPDIPSVDMSFSESNVKAYVEGNSQRTSVITFKADKLQTITFKLPSGVKLVNVTTGKTSAAGVSVEISGGTQFYLTAPLDQAESVSATFSSQMKGSIDKEYSAYKIVTGSGTQDLALVFGEGVENEKYVYFKVTWTKECKVSIVKKDQDTGNTLAGGGDMQAYYVDRFGFAELPDFAAQREKILDIVPEIENVDYENDLTCISFYAAECAEFPVMGEVHYDLTLPEALEAYEKIPSERMHGLKCVGFDLKDGSDYEGMQSLMIEGKIQKEFLNSIPGFRENSYVQNAISRVEKYLEERHPNVENPLESNKKVDNEKNISEEKNEKELNIQMKPIPKKKRGEMSL